VDNSTFHRLTFRTGLIYFAAFTGVVVISIFLEAHFLSSPPVSAWTFLERYWPLEVAYLAIGAPICFFFGWTTIRPIYNSFETQRRFIIDAGHELRTPLAELLLAEQLVAKNGSKMTKTELLKSAYDSHINLTRIESLFSSLLYTIQTEPVELKEIDLGAKIRHGIKKSSSRRVDSKIKPKTVFVRANPGMLEMMLLELCENAFRFGSSNVSISFWNGLLRIRDDGDGIARHDLPRIFDRFYQVDSSHSGAGYGLGLSLVRQLARRQNIKIKVDSRPGAGSIFTLVFRRGNYRDTVVRPKSGGRHGRWLSWFSRRSRDQDERTHEF
jgi:signal transduction histidine kinase